MSYQSAKQKYKDQVTEVEEPHGHNCFANGCPMAGGISTGLILSWEHHTTIN